MTLTTLTRLQDNKITPEKAYNEIYKNEKQKGIGFFRRANFVKLRITVPSETKGVNRLLRVLFFMPFPIIFLRVILGFIKFDEYSDDMPFTKTEMIRLIRHRGIKVEVNSHSGEKVLIKTI